MDFLGYQRANGSVGTRNYVVVLPVANCSNDAAYKLSKKVPGVIPLCHAFACCNCGDDRAKAYRGLLGLGKNPNVFAVLVLGIGCEPFFPEELAEKIAKTGKRVMACTVDSCGGYDSMMECGEAFLREAMLYAELENRTPCDVSNLMLGMKCSGSGAVSILANNLAVGKAADILISYGGSAIFGETSELLGAEQTLAQRAASPQVADKLLRIIDRLYREIDHYGVDILGSEPSTGNIHNGLTTIEEKALGNIVKSGTKPLIDVLEFGEEATKGSGLYFMDCEALQDSNFVGFMAAGSQIGFVSTSSGLPSRCRAMPSSSSGVQVYPCVKVLGSSNDKDQISFFDEYVGTLLTAEETLDEAGERIFKSMLDYASGKQTYCERNGEYYQALSFFHSGLSL